MTEPAEAWLARLAGRLPGPLGHDLNNILAVLLGSLDLLDHQMERQDGAAPIRARTTKLRGAVTRASALAAALTALAAASGPVDPNELLSRLLPLLAVAAGSRVRITPRFAADLPAVAAEPVGLRAVLLAIAFGLRDAEIAAVTLEAAALPGALHLIWHGLPALPAAEADSIAAYLRAQNGRVALSADPPAVLLILPAGQGMAKA